MSVSKDHTDFDAYDSARRRRTLLVVMAIAGAIVVLALLHVFGIVGPS
jgi:hypothetical protein